MARSTPPLPEFWPSGEFTLGCYAFQMRRGDLTRPCDIVVRGLSPLRLSVDLPLSGGGVNGFNLVRR